MFEKKYTPEEIVAIEKYLRNSNLAFAARTSLLIKNLYEHVQHLEQSVKSLEASSLKDDIIKEHEDLILHQREVIGGFLIDSNLGFQELLTSVITKLETGIESEKGNPNHVAIIKTCQALIKAYLPQNLIKRDHSNDTESKSSE